MIKLLAVISFILVPLLFGIVMIPILNHIERVRKERRGE